MRYLYLSAHMKGFKEKIDKRKIYELLIITVSSICDRYSILDRYLLEISKVLRSIFGVGMKEAYITVCQLISGNSTQYLDFLYITLILQLVSTVKSTLRI